MSGEGTIFQHSEGLPEGLTKRVTMPYPDSQCIQCVKTLTQCFGLFSDLTENGEENGKTKGVISNMVERMGRKLVGEFV